MTSKRKIAICGSGFIGRGWAILFASGGYDVSIYDTDENQIKEALKDIKQQLTLLNQKEMLRGNRSITDLLFLIKGATTLEECVKDAIFIQECVPENVEIKKKVCSEIDEIMSAAAILASSSSSISPSFFTSHLKNKKNCLINHPINPLYIIRLVEIVPAPWTDPEALKFTRTLMEELGQSPVVFQKEIIGFGANRIQVAILNECWQLVQNGYLSANDVDKLMSEGIGMRYALQGPIETLHLLSDGIERSIAHFGHVAPKISGVFTEAPNWTSEGLDLIIKQITQSVPIEEIPDRRLWRDERLIEVAKLKKKFRN